MTPKADHVSFESNSDQISQLSELGNEELNQPVAKPSAMTPKADYLYGKHFETDSYLFGS